MSAFHRMVTYLYLYDHNTKGRNIGFAKIEKRGDKCLVEIHMKNTGHSISSIPVYFYAQKQQNLPGILLGNMSLIRGNGDFKAVLEEGNISGSGYALEDVKGIFIPFSEEVMFVSQWDNDPFVRESFLPLETGSSVGTTPMPADTASTHASTAPTEKANSASEDLLTQKNSLSDTKEPSAIPSTEEKNVNTPQPTGTQRPAQLPKQKNPTLQESTPPQATAPLPRSTPPQEDTPPLGSTPPQKDAPPLGSTPPQEDASPQIAPPPQTTTLPRNSISTQASASPQESTPLLEAIPTQKASPSQASASPQGSTTLPEAIPTQKALPSQASASPQESTPLPEAIPTQKASPSQASASPQESTTPQGSPSAKANASSNDQQPQQPETCLPSTPQAEQPLNKTAPQNSLKATEAAPKRSHSVCRNPFALPRFMPLQQYDFVQRQHLKNRTPQNTPAKGNLKQTPIAAPSATQAQTAASATQPQTAASATQPQTDAFATQPQTAASAKAKTPHKQQAASPTEDWPLKWQFLLEHYPVMTPFAGDENTLCIRLELKDLRLLPQKYWYLGNNSFLLHGFFNYRYLILGMTEKSERKKWFIGIPGVFQNPERVMATLFGFPGFRNEKSAPINTGEFGYWYRFLDE